MAAATAAAVSIGSMETQGPTPVDSAFGAGVGSAAAGDNVGMQRLWLRDAERHSLWAGTEVPPPQPTAEDEDEGRLSRSLECSGVVPWWVSHVVATAGDLGQQAVPLCIGDNFVRLRHTLVAAAGLGSVTNAGDEIDWSIAASREEPLKRLAVQLGLRDYELAQLTVTLVVALFCIALNWQVHSFLPALVFGVILVTRLWPELYLLIMPGHFGIPPRSTRGAQITCACVAALWFVYIVLSTARGYYVAGAASSARSLTTPPPPASMAVDAAVSLRDKCSALKGIDCIQHLRDWAGPDTCATLAYTDGTCYAFCRSYDMLCLRASDDLGTGGCGLATSVPRGQNATGDGCMESWRTQVCVCAPLPPRPSDGGSKAPDEARAVPARSSEDDSLEEVDCDEDVADWRRSWSDEKKSFCCATRGVGCPTEPAVVDCDAGFSNWREVWSAAKAEYCCNTHGKACDSLPQVAPVPPAPKEEEWKCLRVDYMYMPLDMPGQGRTMARTVAECQARCVKTLGCARFTWWPADGFCHLQEYRAELRATPGAIAGPASCEEERELAVLRGELPSPTPAPTHSPARSRPRTERRPATPDRTPPFSGETAPPAKPSHPEQRLGEEAPAHHQEAIRQPPPPSRPPPVSEASHWTVIFVLLVFSGLAFSGALMKR